MSLATSNIFAALDPKKAKKSSKESKKEKLEKAVSAADLEAAIFSKQQQNITSWADEDEDDFHVNPLPDAWAQVSRAGVVPQMARRAYTKTCAVNCRPRLPMVQQQPKTKRMTITTMRKATRLATAVLGL